MTRGTRATIPAGRSLALLVTATVLFVAMLYAAGLPASFKFGAKISNEHKGYLSFQPAYDYTGGNPLTLATFPSSYNNPGFYKAICNGCYALAPFGSMPPVNKYYVTHQGQFQQEGGQAVADLPLESLEIRRSGGNDPQAETVPHDGGQHRDRQRRTGQRPGRQASGAHHRQLPVGCHPLVDELDHDIGGDR